MSGNPVRYFFENKFIVRRPEIDKAKKQLKLATGAFGNLLNYHYDYPGNKFDEYYDIAIVDMYSAPDVIMTYSNGNTCKDEWCRYSRWQFNNLKLTNIDTEEDYVVATFTFDKAVNVWDKSIMETDIPLGKFQGMSPKEVENYKRKNFYKFKDWKPNPSKEAIESAFNACGQSIPLDEIERILIAAYEVDL